MIPGRSLLPKAIGRSVAPAAKTARSKAAAAREDRDAAQFKGAEQALAEGEPEDDVTEAWGFELGLRVFRGHATDVLSRFTTIAAETGADWLVRVKADNPFLDERCVDLLVDARDSSECSKQSDLLLLHGGLLVEGEDGHKPAPRLPVGYGVELLRSDALAVAAREIPENEPHHRVHVTSWLAANAKNHAVPTPLDWPDRPDWRWTIDTYKDLAMARSAFRLFGEDALTIDYPSMVERLE